MSKLTLRNEKKKKMQRILKMEDLKALSSFDQKENKKHRSINIWIGLLSFLVMFLVWEYFNYGF